MRKEYELSQEDLGILLDASKETPVMYLSGGELMAGTAQENANRAWKEMGKKYGFIWNTAQPVPGKSQRCITAIELSGNTAG